MISPTEIWLQKPWRENTCDSKTKPAAHPRLRNRRWAWHVFSCVSLHLFWSPVGNCVQRVETRRPRERSTDTFLSFHPLVWLPRFPFIISLVSNGLITNIMFEQKWNSFETSSSAKSRNQGTSVTALTWSHLWTHRSLFILLLTVHILKEVLTG